VAARLSRRRGDEGGSVLGRERGGRQRGEREGGGVGEMGGRGGLYSRVCDWLLWAGWTVGWLTFMGRLAQQAFAESKALGTENFNRK
jgi:hypothetical protein